MKIIIDAFGGDYAPKEIIDGTVKALEEEKDFIAVLCGKQEIINECLKEYSYDKSNIEIIDAPEVIGNNESPTEAIRNKEKSSITVALNTLNSDKDAVGFVSAGSTGAVLTGSVLLLKRIRGINRPALCPVLPTVRDKNVLLMDCGANSDPKPMNIRDFAIMATAYSKSVFGIKEPVIGLLSNGTEDKKGNAFNKEVFPLLKSTPNINFKGNIEGRDILSGDVDIVVCDGFSGNIALKSCEGTALAMFSLIKDGIVKGGLRAKLGYLLLKPVLKEIKKKMDYNNNGGAVLLGLEKIVVKSHGSSKSKAIKNSILQVKKLYDEKVVDNIKNELLQNS